MKTAVSQTKEGLIGNFGLELISFVAFQKFAKCSELMYKKELMP